MSESRPLITAVVATHDRAHLLPRLLRSLIGQQGVPFEVVVVDDASTDDTWKVLQRFQNESAALQPLRQERNTGPAAARNRGWRAAGAELVAFTDDDCVPQPGWLAAMAAALVEADLVQGQTLPDPEWEDHQGPFSRTIQVTEEQPFYQTCNMGYRRALLEQLGGFDERFRRPSGEDTDLAWRAKEAGAKSVFAETAVVFHDVRPSSFLTHLRDTWRWGDCVLTLREHPQLRRLLHRRWFFRPSHAPASLALIGLSIAVTPGRARSFRLASLLLLTPYVRFRTHRVPLRGGPRRRLAAVPAALVADMIEVGVMVIASIRYRTIVI